ncbi:hypothetical protein HZC30_05410 [Candidatus Woesearchaeota archaeon]|nr:hypothetical protein [Candidatus Woesearchaeota archaeon]
MVLDAYFTREDKFNLTRSEKLKPDKSVFPSPFLPDQTYWAVLDIRQEEVREGQPFKLLGEFY